MVQSVAATILPESQLEPGSTIGVSLSSVYVRCSLLSPDSQ